MQVEALKTFNGRLGLIRTGSVITVPDRYGKELVQRGLAKLHTPRSNEPESNTDLGGPVNTKGAEGEGDEGNVDGGSQDDDTDDNAPPEETTSKQGQESGSTESSTAERRTAGRARPLSSQQVGRRSRKKT